MLPVPAHRAFALPRWLLTPLLLLAAAAARLSRVRR